MIRNVTSNMAVEWIAEAVIALAGIVNVYTVLAERIQTCSCC